MRTTKRGIIMECAGAVLLLGAVGQSEAMEYKCSMGS